MVLKLFQFLLLLHFINKNLIQDNKVLNIALYKKIVHANFLMIYLKKV